MLGESMTARNSSSWWISIYLLQLARRIHRPALAAVFHPWILHPCKAAPHSTLPTSACGKFHSHVPSHLCECLLAEWYAADPQALVRRKEKGRSASGMAGIDWLILSLYIVFVVGIGFALKSSMKTSTDFFLAGRAIPAWVCGLAFISANLGAQEVIGMGASGAKYGIATSHFYWVGAIPAMVFVGIFMMPFYYGSRARSVPEYLRLRFDEKTRGLNAVSFATMTIFSSGISMYAMAKLIQTLHFLDGPFRALGLPQAWIFHTGIIVSALVVLTYIYLGGLTSAIYNEVLQFFLIVAGFIPLVWLGLKNVGGWAGLKATLGPSYVHSWVGMGNPHTNRLGVEWFGLAMGLGFVLSFGYWCTDFLVVQRAMAANSMSAARRTPLIAAVPK